MRFLFVKVDEIVNENKSRTLRTIYLIQGIVGVIVYGLNIGIFKKCREFVVQYVASEGYFIRIRIGSSPINRSGAHNFCDDNS